MPKCKKNKRYRPGQCYTNCFVYLVQHHEQHPDMRIVHGVIWTQELGNFAHSWIECDGKCLDPNNGFPIERADYYRRRRVDERETHAYTYKQAAVEFAKSQHFGPWQYHLTCY